jgi:hypothetical protein
VFTSAISDAGDEYVRPERLSGNLEHCAPASWTSEVGGAVEIAGAVEGHGTLRVLSVGAVELVEDAKLAGRAENEDRSKVGSPTANSCAVEVAVGIPKSPE